MSENRSPNFKCLIGSVKTNIGHTEAAAGIAGIIKTALALKNRKLPGSLHFEAPNPLIPFDKLPLKVASSSCDSQDLKQKLIAGVSGFGFGGTNVHIVLEDFDQSHNSKSINEINSSALPIFISAKSPEALQKSASLFSEVIRKEDISIPEISRAACLQRNHHKYRLSVLSSSVQETANDLIEFAKGEQTPRIITGHNQSKGQNSICLFGSKISLAGNGTFVAFLPHICKCFT